MNNKRTVNIPFGLINIGGLMDYKEVSNEKGEIEGFSISKPLFCSQSYKIKPTLNNRYNEKYGFISEDGSYYQKKFRRMVLWDFGDGFTSEEYSVEHAYERPGRYRITCTLYDINRVAWKNTFYVEVVVKELLPTLLSFDTSNTTSVINCSKIEKIARIEALLSNSCENDLQIKAQRIFDENEENSKEKGRSFLEIKPEIFKFVKKYWTFLENEEVKYYRTNDVYQEYLKPCTVYTPNYESIYGRFYYDSTNEQEPIQVSLFHVIPYKNVDETLTTIRVLNPNCDLDELVNFDGRGEEFFTKFYKEIKITQVYLKEQLPSNAFFVGKRAFVDIFYKNDYASTKNRLVFHYDIEEKNITKELISSDNYLNVNPIGLDISVTNNELDKVKIGVSLDGFLRQVDKENDYTIDEYLMNSLISGIDLDFYFFPYIEYNDNDVCDMLYYIPKDIDIEDLWGNNNGSSYIIDAVGGETNKGEEVEPQLWRTRIRLVDDIDQTFSVKIKGGNEPRDVKVYKNPIIVADKLIIPKEKGHKEDIKRLINAYTLHPMFTEADNVKEFFERILGENNFLNYTMTKSKNFLDDRANVRTCYLSNLINTLKMMGEDILEYEKGSFEGVNEMRDFVRILSMNHTDLVGHVIKKPHDITVRVDKKGKNVSDKIDINDILYISDGKIKYFMRNKNVYACDTLAEDGVQLIIQDKYTFDTKIVNFGLLKESTMESSYDVGEETLVCSLGDYDHSWGWNLLLPKRFETCKDKLKKNGNLYSNAEIKRIKDVIKSIIDGYYSFYLLDPSQESKRVGNFLDEKTISKRVQDPDMWAEDWGVAHEILMKIIRDSGDLKNNEEDSDMEDDNQMTYSLHGDVANDTYWATVDNTVQVTCQIDGKQQKTFQGKLMLLGCINGKGEHSLEMQLKDCHIRGTALKTDIEWLQFDFVVGENMDIPMTVQEFEIRGGDYEGILSVNLWGLLENKEGKTHGLKCEASIDLISQ